ncbi:hypothetical protein [Paenibacillus kribbensis]|uniref:hypothetical protein n=1 Tax=Paenibacillus kribbensis TaxID=172713 RepID=UPI00083833CC|nr:hypothetical protein [Paenibacillus kribbensis]
MASPKLNLVLNAKANEIITLAAGKMGTSKRNVISLALAEILKTTYDKRFIDSLANEITTSVPTASTVNEQIQEKIEKLERYGHSRRVFFGLLISDYFLHNQDKFKITELDESDSNEGDKGHIEITLDRITKEKIVRHCKANAMSVSSLFSHYILSEEIKVDSFVVEEKSFLNLVLGENVKKALQDRSNSTNRTYRFYLNLIAEQIARNISV